MRDDDIPSLTAPEGARNQDQIELLKHRWRSLVGFGSESVPVAITSDRRLIIGCADAIVAADLRSRERFLLTAVKQIIPIEGLRYRVPGQERSANYYLADADRRYFGGLMSPEEDISFSSRGSAAVVGLSRNRPWSRRHESPDSQRRPPWSRRLPSGAARARGAGA